MTSEDSRPGWAGYSQVPKEKRLATECRMSWMEERGKVSWCEGRDDLLHRTTQLSLRSRAERTEHCQQLVVEMLWTPGCVSSRL